MIYLVSHTVLDQVLAKHSIRSNDLTGIDKLFGGADGYYWYHTLRHLCPKGEERMWATLEAMHAAVQGHEDETAAEDEVKPQLLKEEHLAALARHLGREA